MDLFREAVNSCNLVDLGFVGYEYIWGQNSKDGVKCRLDRGFATRDWQDLFTCI